MSNIEDKLKELKIELPKISKPIANYVGYVVSGNMVYISGQLPMLDGKVAYTDQLGGGISVEVAYKAARLCGINILAQLKDVCDGDLDKVKRCVKLGIFVNSTSTFTDHPKVGNGCSDLMVEVFGEEGRHSRFAVGCSQLPLNATVEISAMFEIKND